MGKLIVVLIGLVLCLSSASAQSRVISGKILDSKGNPIPGLSIHIKGGKAGTSADAEGAFRITVSEGTVLVVSGVGYQTQDVPVGTKNELIISMRQSDANLSEVVVTALGIRREKRTLTYATQEVKGSSLVEAKQDNLVNALAGKVAGVQITNSSGMPGSSSRITVRGTSSLMGDNTALLVVDGIPIDNEEPGNPDGTLGAGSTANRAADIDPNTIESINVLKGAAATALYGSAAARGVVMITTKAGSSRAAKPTVSVASSYSFENPILPKFQNLYGQGLGGVYSDGNAAPGSPYSWGPRVDTLTVGGKPVPIRDNVKDFFRTGHTTDNNVTVSGASDRNNYLVSYSYLHTDGTEPKTDYLRHNLFAKYVTKILPNLNLSVQFAYSHAGNHRLLEGNGLSNPLWTIYAAPITWNPFPYTNPDGTQRVYRTGRNSPYWLVNNTGLYDRTDRILPVINLSYNPLSWLSLTERLGGDMYIDHIDYHENTGIVSGISTKGRVYSQDQQFQQLNHDFIIEARKDLTPKLFADLVVGNNIYSKYQNNNFVSGVSLAVPGFYNISNAANVTSTYNSYNTRKVGFYAQATLEYMKMITLNLTGRLDGSSVLSVDKQFYTYSSASLGFIFTEALGMASNPILNFGKVRVSYSSVGNDNVQPYSLTIPYSQNSIGNIVFPYNNMNGFQYGTTYAFPLKNESLKEFETGLETKFFQNRASLDVTYYYRKSTDLLTGAAPFAPGTGFSSASLNAGSMDNRGIEVVLGFTPIKTRDWQWDVSVNWSKIKNRVLALAPGITNLQFAGFTHPGIFAFANQPYGDIYGTAFVRDSASGKLLLGDDFYPQVSTENSVIGNVTPNWLGGLTSNLTYKAFSLSFTLDCKNGGQVLNLDNHYLFGYGVPKVTQNRGQMHVFDGIVESTGKQNTTAVPLDQHFYQSVFAAADESSVEDASYLKLRQATLGYNFASSLVKSKVFKGLTLTVTATNFILHKNYTGSDPEVSLNGSGNGQGFGNFMVPSNHNIIVGLKASF